MENIVSRVTTSYAKGLVSNVSLTNQFLVTMPSLNITEGLGKHIHNQTGITKDYLTRKLGFLCSEASLPASSYATSEVKDNFMGVTEEFAHTRIVSDSDFTFYVDSEYKSLKFFESWMDWIGGAGRIQQAAGGYYRRYNYPKTYKKNICIYKFEKNVSGYIKYEFINAFPKTISPLPLSYGQAEILKLTVSFNYDRYIVSQYKELEKSDSGGSADPLVEAAYQHIMNSDRYDAYTGEYTPDIYSPAYNQQIFYGEKPLF